jgi:membrane dipeptidase
MRIADLHCDLLSYLAEDLNRTPFGDDSRCSARQLKRGKVIFQTLAIYTQTEAGSTQLAEKQLDIFQTLPTLYPDTFERLSTLKMPQSENKVHIAFAIENASGLCDENEPLDNAFRRFEEYRERGGPCVYMSLTWNHENRFAGGNLSETGLKRDGELLLEYLNGKECAIDLSHTSDKTAYDILNTLDKKRLRIIPIASHSNFRAICDRPRNLSDEIAQEIVKRGGVIGFNLFRPFVGEKCPDDFKNQIDYARTLGVFNQFCFGADFFYDQSLATSLYPLPYFYEPFGNSGCYPDLIHYLNDYFTQFELEKIAHKNLSDFFGRIGRSI